MALLVLALIPGAAQGRVCGDLTCSSGETCTNCALDCAAWLGCSAQATDIVVADFAIDDGPVTHRASGFIGADLSNTAPSDATFLPVRPRLLSWQLFYNAFDRANREGIVYEIKLWDKSLIPSTIDGNWSNWESHVRTKVRGANGNPLAHFDIWNEPELSSYWGGALDARYFEMWRRAHAVIRAEHPSALIVGPSTTSHSWLKNTFLPTVRQMGVLPDVLSWHENNEGASVLARVTEMRDHLQANGIAIDRISINEYMGSSHAMKPGIAVRFFSQLERARVDWAAKACWEEVSGGIWECAPHFDSLTTASQQRRSIWWAYKAYADMAGRLVATTGTGRVSALASDDASSAQGRVVLGVVASGGPIELKLVNVDRAAFYQPGRNLRVVASRIPNTESSPLAAPQTEVDLEYAVTGNTTRIVLGNPALWDAYTITLYADGTSGPVDADDDGTPAGTDCDDSDPAMWLLPTAPRDLRARADKRTWDWSPPADPGTNATLGYDLLRAGGPIGFDAADCVEVGGTDLTAQDPAVPPEKAVRYYLVRAVNGCGDGPVGTAGSGGPTRAPRSCP